MQECGVTCGDEEREVPALSAPRHLLVAPGQEVGQGGQQVEGDHGEGGPVAGGESHGISQHCHHSLELRQSAGQHQEEQAHGSSEGQDHQHWGKKGNININRISILLYSYSLLFNHLGYLYHV